MAVVDFKCGYCNSTFGSSDEMYRHVCAAKQAHTIPPNATETVLEEAQRIVLGARRDDYGTPLENHSRTAALWNAYIGSSIHVLTARDVCMLNILQKVSRDRHCPKRDNLVDIAGFALNAAMCSETT